VIPWGRFNVSLDFLSTNLILQIHLYLCEHCECLGSHGASRYRISNKVTLFVKLHKLTVIMPFPAKKIHS
jgi:hypothetical protein